MKAKHKSDGIPYCPAAKFEEFYVDLKGNPPPSFSHPSMGNASSYFSIFLRTENPCKAEIDINRSEFFKILFITRGSGILQYGTGEFRIDPGCLLFLKPTEVKSWKATSMNQEGFYLIFNELFLTTNPWGFKELKDSCLFDVTRPVLPLDSAQLAVMHPAFDDLYVEFSGTNSFREEMCRLRLKIILLQSRRFHEGTDHKMTDVCASAAVLLTRRFQDLLEGEFTVRKKAEVRLRSPSDYAEELCVHTNYLNASVKRTTGRTTQELIKDRILHEACILLKYTHLTAADIAHDLGFRETTHFCSLFKKMASVTPLEYRRMAGREHASAFCD